VAKLKIYRAKRDFGRTSEPRGATSRKQGRRYVIQKHAATRLHYDLRLELGGVMLSWAVTRGPSLVPGDKRLAVHVEDHPIEYNTFEGTIPKGQYGGGTVMIWDRGTWTPEFDPELGMKKGHLEFTLHGKKLKGRWHLVRMQKRPGERQEPWLLIKGEDEFARTKSEPDILEEMPDSVASRRSMEQIAEGRSRVWHSNKPASEQSSRRVAAKQKPKTKPREPRAKTRISGTKGDKKEKSSGSLRKPSRVSGARRAALPVFVSPSLATLAAKAPNSADFVHEIKFDGYRMQARIGGGKVELRTRTGLDWTGRFPTVAEALKALKRWDAIIDGEIVSGDARGVSDFSALQDDLKSGRRDRLVYYAFDLMHLDGYDLTGTTLIERKELLEALLAALPKDGIVRLSEHFDTDGSKMLHLARDMKLEGIVSKRRESHYRAGRVGDWLKIKCTDSQELVVAGYAPSDVSPKRMAALVLGYYDKLGFTYAGRVGTGFTDKMRDDFWKRLQPLRIDHCPFGRVPEEERTRAVHWVKPQMVIEVDFRGWTGAGYVRQASFKGVREDKPAKQVVRETEQQPVPEVRQAAAHQPVARKTSPAKGKKTPVVIAGVTLTHPERVYWDDAGVTKQMLAEYYETVWDRMRPHVAGRVLSLVRAPDGIGGQTFYQKHASAGMDRERLRLVKEPDGEESISIDDLGGLVSLAQAGVLEVHVRGSTIEHLEDANRLVFDLDPGPGVDWKDVIAAAREVRERLTDLKLTSFVKTTGGKGLHVVLPIRPAPWDEVKEFCREIAESMAADNRARYTATIKKSARHKRIFIDYLRNSREATAIAPYSTRARPGATVSVPLSWEELGAQKAPNLFTVLNLSKRLARQRKDPWADMARIKQSLPKLRK
jgi:bifunctional non-homologous end joining protein LigD